MYHGYVVCFGKPTEKISGCIGHCLFGGVGWSKRLPGWFGALIKRVLNYSSSNGYLACFERVVKACQYDLWHLCSVNFCCPFQYLFLFITIYAKSIFDFGLLTCTSSRLGPSSQGLVLILLIIIYGFYKKYSVSDIYSICVIL